jgi:xylulokinase
MSYLGIDVGTSGCKAGRFDARGSLLALAYCEYPLITPQIGWAEIDSATVCQSCIEAIREAAAGGPADPVAALAISSQGEAFTPVAVDGAYLGSGMVSFDVRSEPFVAEFSRNFGPERLYQLTGHTPHTMFTLFKLLWLRRYRPEVWRAAAKFYCFEELLQRRLGIEPAISWPLAGRTMLFNVRTHQWEEEILSAIPLEACRLARPVASGTVVGTISPGVAVELGLPRGVVVVSGGHDQPCGALGAGIVEPGMAMYSTGTTECICPLFHRPVFHEDLFRSNLCTYDSAIPGTYTTVAFSLTGGNLLTWFRDQWCQAEIQEAARTGDDPYEVILRGMESEPTDLFVLPYFTTSGTPYCDPQVPGAILGLRLSTTRGQILRALLEGVALEMRQNVELLARVGLMVRQFRAIGGGAKSLALTQLKADVLGRPVTTLAVTEAACLGAAMLACAGHTGAQVRELAGDWVKTTRVVEPDSRRAALYATRFAAHRQLYPMVRGFYASLGAGR